MGLRDVLKKKKRRNKSNEFVSYSTKTEEGKNIEAYGYWYKSNMTELFDKYDNRDTACSDDVALIKHQEKTHTQFETEYVLRNQLHYMFEISSSVGKTHDFIEYVGYDKITGIPYRLTEDIYQLGHALISEVYGLRITYEQVALYAKKHIPDSEFVNINSFNYKKFITMVSEYEFINGNINLYDDKFILKRAKLSHKIVNGVRCAYQCITEDFCNDNNK